MSFYQSVVDGEHRVHDDLSRWLTTVGNHVGPLTVAALVLGTTLLVAYAIIVVFFKPRNELAEILEPYRLHRAPVLPKAEGGPIDVKLPVLRRFADVLSGAAEHRGFRPAIEEKLVRAALPVGVGEFLMFAVGGIVVLGLLGFVVGGVIMATFALVVGLLAPVAVLQVLVERRSKLFTAQLPDVLKLLAGSLRAGFSLLQGLDAVVEQIGDPIQRELRRALAASRLGAPIEDALTEMADRVGSQDFAWTVMAIRIQREVGGNLAQILDTVWDTMIQRQRLRREVKTLTAEGRMSAIILVALPIVLGGFIYLVNRAYIRQLFASMGGQVMVVGAVVLELLGTWWMYRTIQIEI
jgi:tight adherence protein B